MTTTLAFALRPAVPADADFEHALYASTRDDLRPLGPEVFDGLVGMQFRAQSMSIRLDHPDAEHKIVLVENAPVGRLIIDGAVDPIEVIDVALLPQYRGQGIGTSVLRGVLAQVRQRHPGKGEPRGVAVKVGRICGSWRVERSAIPQALGRFPVGRHVRAQLARDRIGQ